MNEKFLKNFLTVGFLQRFILCTSFVDILLDWKGFL